MGPRSDNRGYAPRGIVHPTKRRTLQWVHGPITVVMIEDRFAFVFNRRLQWVHGPITVVMRYAALSTAEQHVLASMGPRSDNRGYDRQDQPGSSLWTRFNGSTVR